jgi:hypothetical protein
MTSRSFKRSVLRSINNISVARILPGVCNPWFYRTSLFGFYDYSTQSPVMRSLRCLLNTNTRVVAGSLRGEEEVSGPMSGKLPTADLDDRQLCGDQLSALESRQTTGMLGPLI